MRFFMSFQLLASMDENYLKTMRNKGYSSLEAITISLKGEIPM